MRGRIETRRQRRLPVHPLILAAAAFWLLLTVLVLAGIQPQPADASSRQASSPMIPAVSPGETATVVVSPTSTPTTTAPTATPVKTATTTPTGTVTPKKTPTATATVASGNGGGGGTQGGGGGGGPSSAGPSVTRVVFSQPTVAAGNDSAVPGLAGATFGSNGLLVAATMSCMVGLLGLTVAVIALSVLVRRGYGPFLRALLRGKRAGQRRGKQGKDGADSGFGGLDGFGGGSDSSYLPGAGTAYGGSRSMASGQYQPEPYARNGQGSAYRAPAPARSPRQSPATRSRADWR